LNVGANLVDGLHGIYVCAAHGAVNGQSGR
jgi:hypothetical protein